MSYYEEHRPAFLAGLQEFLRIPSISTLSEHRTDIRRAAAFVLDERESLRYCFMGITMFNRRIHWMNGSLRRLSRISGARIFSRAALRTTRGRRTF